MKLKLHRSQHGLGAPLIIVALVVLLGIGGAAYYVMSKDKDDGGTSNNSAASKEIEAECKKEIDDKDFCKFASNVSFDESYKSTITTTSAEGGSVMLIESDGKGNTKAITTVNGAEVAAYIQIGNTTYTKDSSDGAWFKFTNETPEDTNAADNLDFDFDEDPATPDNTEYKKLDKEACGNLTCFKYQIIDPDEPTTENFIWFDDKDYKLRRMSYKNTEGSSDLTYSYEAVVILEPSPVKDMPGLDTNSEDLEAQLEAAMQQYQNLQ